MELNSLESRFFRDILHAELGVPVHATLEYQGDTLDVIVVPEVAPNGYFSLKYYNAPASDTETPNANGGISFKRWSTSQFFGIHPLLEQAWLNSDPVTVRLHPSPLPIDRRPSSKLDAILLYAAPRHRGAIGLNKNRVVLQPASLKRAEFCIVGFPDFKSLIRQPIELVSGDGWNIRLSRDEQPTRNSVSHTGSIERTDGREYDAGELDDVLDGLKYFLAYAAGEYCLPTVVIGYDIQRRPILGDIGRFEADGPRTSNWFKNSSVPEGTTLKSLFPIFWHKWNTSKNEITALIEGYVHSNVMKQAGIPKDAVAKSYAGLEILVSLVLKKTISEDSSKTIYGVLLDHHIPNVDLSEPSTPTMTRLSKNLNIGNCRGPYLLNTVRNYVGHPLDRRTPAEVKDKHLKYLDANPMHYFYLHDLSQFYLEYMFLEFLGYKTSDHRKLLETMQQI